jgi:hypothetical protein
VKKRVLVIVRYSLFYAMTAVVICLILWAVANILVTSVPESGFGGAVRIMLLGLIGCELGVAVATLLTILVIFLNWINRRISSE